MIILFHHVISLIRHLIRENKRQKVLCEFKKIQQNISDINFAKSWAYKDAEQELRFDPPVYRQRYGTIHDILLNAKWRKDLKKIVEFGCAELGLFIFLKNLMGITEINFVDIDEVLLSENLFRVKPLTVEYLRKRSDPLTVNVFAGSITDPDKRILDADVVIGIEIIEHLYPDILEAVPYTVFHCIQPKLAIFTTPNADFNELLPNLKGFRHSDHKFEWTREQLESWSINITDRFPQYFATFHGIGSGPEGTESLGCCSQMVVFVRKDIVDPSYILPTVRCFCSGDMLSEHQYAKITKEKCNFCPSCCPMQSYGICTYFSYAKHFENLKTESPGALDAENLIFYKLLQSVDFPYEKDDRTQEEKILDELKYKINSLGYCNGRFFNVDKLRSEIPLVELMYSSFGQFITMPEVETLLSRNGYTLQECQTNEEDDEKQLCVIYEPEMEDFSSSESEASGYESGHSRFLNEASLSDWEDYGFPNEREGQKGRKFIQKKTKMDDNTKRLKALHDSGLVKNQPRTGTSQPTPRETHDKVFGSFTSLKDSSLRNRIKAAIMSDCKFEPLFSTESLLRPGNRPLPDPNKVNELDCLNNRNQSRPLPIGKTFFSQLMRTQHKFSSRKSTRKTCREGKEKTPPVSPANTKRKRKKPLSDSEDEVMTDVKSIANCLLENTLNKLDIKESSKLIADHIDDPTVETPPTDSVDSSLSNFQIVNIPIPSTSTSRQKNSVKKKPTIRRNSPVSDGYNSGPESNTASQDTIESVHGNKAIKDVSRVSIEALFDPNSQADLLEDFDIPPLLHEFDSVQNVAAAPNAVVLIGVNLLNDNDAVPPNGGVFPEWLLQMLRTNFPLDGEVIPEGPHFYSQGDGLGVHPSVLAIDFNDDDEDASSESSSTNGSAGLTGNENSIQDIAPLPSDRQTASGGSRSRENNIIPCGVNSTVGNPQLTMHNEESEEFFDTTDELNNYPKKKL